MSKDDVRTGQRQARALGALQDCEVNLRDAHLRLVAVEHEYEATLHRYKCEKGTAEKELKKAFGWYEVAREKLAGLLPSALDVVAPVSSMDGAALARAQLDLLCGTEEA